MKWLRWWWPALVWAALITSFSTDAFSSEHTSRFLFPLLQWLFPAASVAKLHLWHHYLRKAGHVSEYFVLSVWLFRAVRGTQTGWRMEWALAAVVASAGWAGLDELHQAFTPSRGPSMGDVLIDVSGAAAAQLVLAALALVWPRRPAVEGAQGAAGASQ